MRCASRQKLIFGKYARYLAILNSLSKAHAEPLMKLTEMQRTAVENMDVDQDIHDFTKDTIRMYGPVPQTEPYTYQLKCTLKDIKAGRFLGNPNSFFNSTLEHCMEMQEEKYPHLDIPIILVNLAQAVSSLGGLTAEGNAIPFCFIVFHVFFSPGILWSTCISA
jgi:hypothetical protein